MGNKAHGGTFANASDNNNRPLGFTYDAAGNLTNTSQYVYDPENRIELTAGNIYTYDADGERVLKSNSSGTPTKRYWVSNGNVLAEADGLGNLSAEYIYFGGKRIARIDLPANSVHYYLSRSPGLQHQDHLRGSGGRGIGFHGLRFRTDLRSGNQSLQIHWKRTRTETQLDYFGARYYSNLSGRFISADPVNSSVGVLRKAMGNPQNLNGYQYANNDPLGKTDLGGYLTIIVPGTNWSAKKWNENSHFYKQVSSTFGEKPMIFNWNGSLRGGQRAKAAGELASKINGYKFAPGKN